MVSALLENSLNFKRHTKLEYIFFSFLTFCLSYKNSQFFETYILFIISGFGRSSRPNFSSDGLEAESQMIKAIEEWRKEMNLKQIILLGHSMGGFLAASYATNYPKHVKHLILADPWGFPEKPVEHIKRDIPLWVRALAYTLSPFNPLWAIRMAGPWGIK